MVIKDFGDGVKLVRTSSDSDWSQFHINCKEEIVPLGAESFRYVKEKVDNTEWNFKNGEAIFCLNFSETHTTYYIKAEDQNISHCVRDRDGGWLLKYP